MSEKQFQGKAGPITDVLSLFKQFLDEHKLNEPYSYDDLLKAYSFGFQKGYSACLNDIPALALIIKQQPTSD